jgi:hypothetical protein
LANFIASGAIRVAWRYFDALQPANHDLVNSRQLWQRNQADRERCCGILFTSQPIGSKNGILADSSCYFVVLQKKSAPGRNPGLTVLISQPQVLVFATMVVNSLRTT